MPNHLEAPTTYDFTEVDTELLSGHIESSPFGEAILGAFGDEREKAIWYAAKFMTGACLVEMTDAGNIKTKANIHLEGSEHDRLHIVSYNPRIGHIRFDPLRGTAVYPGPYSRRDHTNPIGWLRTHRVNRQLGKMSFTTKFF